MRESLIFFFISVPLSKHQRSRGFVTLFEKIYDGEPSYPSFSCNRGGCTEPLFQLCVRVCGSPTLCRYLETIFYFN
jgi:hypothetical protein